MTYQRALRLFLLVVGGCVALVLVAFLIGRSVAPTPPSKPTRRPREAALIEAKGLAEFAPEMDASPTPAAERESAKQIQPVLELMGDGTNHEKVRQAIEQLAKVIQKNPTWADPPFLRASLRLTIGDTNYGDMCAEIDRALRLPVKDVYKPVEMYALRAKVNMLAGMPEHTLSDLEKGLTAADGDSRALFNTGGTKPEEASNSTALNLTDLNALVAKFPNDYRVYVYRGLFYGAFAFFNENLHATVRKDLEHACQLNPDSAVARLYLGNAVQNTAFFTTAAAQDISDVTGQRGGFKEQTYRRALPHYQEAIRLDPNLTRANAEAAQCLHSLKQYGEAIPYYDAVLAREPNNASALNDRGMAKSLTGASYEAAEDFSKSFDLKKTDKKQTPLDLARTLENRARAYVNAQNYDRAIEDYGKAIGYSFGFVSYMMPLSQIRSVYPEFSDISDRDLVEGLRQKYRPDSAPAEFAKDYAQRQKPYEEFVTAGRYVSRGDAYLHSGRWRQATREYARAKHIFGRAMEMENRWKVVAGDASTEISVDVQTLDFTQGNLVSVWTKVVPRHGNGHQQDNYQFDCRARKMKTLASMRYDDGGNVLWSRPEGEWQAVAPETIGERLFAGMCR